MREWNGSLKDYNFVYEGVMIIPSRDYWTYLYKFEWIRIDSTIKGML